MDYLLLTDLQNQILKTMRIYGKTYNAEYLATKLNRSKRGIANSIRTIPKHLINKNKEGYKKPIMITMYSLS
jgi:hypothetical protein